MKKRVLKIVAFMSILMLFGLIFYSVFNKSYVKKKPTIINAKNGETPLHRAAADNNLEFIKNIPANKDYVNARTKKGQTSLHWASRENNAKAIKLLIEKDADVNVKTKMKIPHFT